MAEVVVGAKTSGFSNGLARMQNQWATFKRQVTKKFSLADLGKGLMQGMGIGSVQAAAEQIGKYFSHAAEMAQIYAETVRGAYDNTRSFLSLRMTPQQRINDAQHDIAFQKEMIAQQEQFVKKLQDNPIAATGLWNEVIQEEARKLSGMKDKLGQSQTGLEASKIAERKRQEDRAESKASFEDQKGLLLKQLTPEQVADNALARAQARANKNWQGPDSGEYEAKLDAAYLASLSARQAGVSARLNGIKGDSLARIGGGGNVYAPGPGGLNPQMVISTEITKHTKLLTSIAGNTKPKSGAVAEFVFTK